jgi:hypothetical protein
MLQFWEVCFRRRGGATTTNYCAQLGGVRKPLGPVSFEIALIFLAIVRAWYKVDKLKFGERNTQFLGGILTFSDSLYIELSINTTPTSIGPVMVENWPPKRTYTLNCLP